MRLSQRWCARPATAFSLAVALSTGGCVGVGPLTGKAVEEWTKSYPLAPGGEVRVINTNGKVEIEGVDSSTVEVYAVKTARAVSDEGARQLLPRIVIKEDIKPDQVTVETERLGGIMIGVSFDVQYRVKAPRNAVVTARSTNGQVTLKGLTGKVSAHTTNGGVQATELAGAVEARSTNGLVAVDLAAIGSGKILLSTTNGGVRLTLPDDAKANVSASWTNGGFNATGIKLDITDENRRHLEGKINGGGTSIELRSTNGGIRVRSRTAGTDSDQRKTAERPEKLDILKSNK